MDESADKLPIHWYYFITTPIKSKSPDGKGTGFFFNHRGNTYLITNRHVFEPNYDPFYDTDTDLAESIAVYFRDPENPRKKQRKEYDLIGESGQPKWITHMIHDVDIAALPLEKKLDPVTKADFETGSRALTKELLVPDDVLVSGGDSALVVGYPEDLIDSKTYFPMVRDARIASPYGHPFNGDPYFVTDAIMHPGTSGSPVFSEPSVFTRKSVQDSSVSQIGEESTYFLGVHSAVFQRRVSDEEDIFMDPNFKLNIVWYADLVMEILELDSFIMDGIVPDYFENSYSMEYGGEKADEILSVLEEMAEKSTMKDRRDLILTWRMMKKEGELD